MNRQNISSGAPWESRVGYSRAVRLGNQIEVSGTVAVRDGRPVGLNDPYAQTQCILEIIGHTLQQLDSSLEDVVRTRMYVTDITFWQEVGRAHGEVFGHIRPATSMVEVCRLIAPEYLVEIEATALLAEQG